jgi:DNA-binding response OmpR family regulator
MNVLVVEDELLIAMLLIDYLEEMGHRWDPRERSLKPLGF